MSAKIKLTFLGTSDQIPSADRNHPATLLTFEGENILFDCGEGTQRQFRKAGLNPCKITRICLSHFHGDHVFGLPGLLSTLALSGYNKELKIYGPKGTKKNISEMLHIFNFRREYKIDVFEVVDGGKFVDEENFYLNAEKMEHGISCNAYSFVKKGHLRIDKKKLEKYKISPGPHLAKLKEGKEIVVNKKKFKVKDLTYKDEERKISIVLDTKLNSRIVPFVKNSDIFISESCFTDELKEHAKEHNHMTAKQVGQVAKKAKVKKLVLTHISQRYEKIPKVILKEAQKEFKNTIVVKDLDLITI